MDVRAASPADVSAIEDLVERAYGHYVARIGRRPGPMEDDYASKVRQGHAHVVDSTDGIEGVVVLIPHPDHLLVENVAVDPDRQGRGIGSALLAFAEACARCEGISTLRLYTHEAMAENLAFYPRRGYEEVDRRAENGFRRVFFAKRILL